MRNAILGFVLVFSAMPVSAGEPIALHPDNGHYFLWQGKPAVLVTSGEHYGAVLNLDFDYVRYLDTLAADGLNHTRTWLGTYREIPGSFHITQNTLAPEPGRFACPWARSGEPGYRYGGNKFDLARYDEAYFARLRDFLAQADRRGVVVELNLFCPLYNDDLWEASPMRASNNVNGVGDCPREESLTLKHPRLVELQDALVRKVIAETNAYDNLYYEICNEPYFGGVTLEWQRHIADVIVAAESTLPRKHLISQNIANGRQKVENPHPAVSIFNFHYCVPPDTVAMNFGLNRVIGENETGFRGKADFLYRSEGWDFLLAGGGLYNNLDYSFTAATPDGTLADYQSPGGGSPALRRQLGILKRFLESFPFVRMGPDTETLARASGDLSVRVLSEPGRAYALYVRVPIPEKKEAMREPFRENVVARLALKLPAGTYAAEWIDTKTGATLERETFRHGSGQRELTSPEFADDIALRIQGESRFEPE